MMPIEPQEESIPSLAAVGIFPVTAPAGAGPAPGKPAAEAKIVGRTKGQCKSCTIA